MVRRIALTGGIATGKSHVRALFEGLGVPPIDADRLARAAVATGTPGLAAVTARFGPDVLDPSGALDRRKLGTIVFDDARARRDLEQIVHPYVRAAIDEWFASFDGTHVPFAVADIPLLYETGREGDFDRIVVAACEPATQLRRLMARDHLTRDEAERRIAAQMPVADKVRRADHVVRTDGTFDETHRQVREIAAALS